MQVGDKVFWGNREAIIKEILLPINSQGFYQDNKGYYLPPYLIEFNLSRISKGIARVQGKFLKKRRINEKDFLCIR